MVRPRPTALAVFAATIGMLLLVAGIVLAADGSLIDVRLARIMLFAGVSVLAIVAVVSVEYSRLRAGRTRMRVR
ncbi:hypothetical protein LQ938_02745 [Microbacterium sp. cx-55]|uniref:hypothetical protein n=1 Tax=Microbacterium sp. cx-55 TaxID=2875948 RepID=UPI001CBAA925|nr:hypothetical protein [Microbacterium sp. cx-55]MBZ4486807.1 hypothetical protein [Microbacterium sp. cx-55]UGB35737.1 hypothetical protein LQ938_02745 [Microbacterium sp. cx-55]